MGTSLRRYDFWDRLDVRALLMTTACHTKTIPEITASKSWPILSRDSEAGKGGKDTYKLDCKTDGFSSQNRFKSLLSPVSLSVFSLAPGPFVWLFTRTWIRKNTDRFAIYVQAWCTYKVIGETVVFLFIACSDEERGDMKLLRPCSRYLPCSSYSWRFMYGYRVLLHGHYTFLSTNWAANGRQTNTAGLFWYRWLCTLPKPKKSYFKKGVLYP